MDPEPKFKLEELVDFKGKAYFVNTITINQAGISYMMRIGGGSTYELAAESELKKVNSPEISLEERVSRIESWLGITGAL